MRVPREADVFESAKNLLCGDLPTIALLVGLKPAQYWTNAVAPWSANESLLRDLPDGEKTINAMDRPIVLWKPLETSLIQYDPAEMSRLILKLYLEMFQKVVDWYLCLIAPKVSRSRTRDFHSFLFCRCGVVVV
jgi:hypothetical protein